MRRKPIKFLNLKRSILVLILATILLLLSNSTNAQDKNHNSLSFSFLNDTKLFLFGDNIGNKPLTYNGLYKLKLKGYQNKDLSYLFLHVDYEHAFLDFLKYERYSFNLGYSFSVLIAGFELNPSIGYGFIVRGFSSQSFSVQTELLYKFKRFSIVYLLQYVQRTDFGHLYNTEGWVLSGFLGIEFNILR